MSKKRLDLLSEYTDVTSHFSNRSLRLSLWYVQHKRFLSRLGTVLLGTVGIGLLLYSLVLWVFYGAVGFWQDRDALSEHVLSTVDYAAIQDTYRPVPLSFGPISFFDTGSGKYSFFTEVQNVNAQYVVALTYHFAYDGGRTPTMTTTVLPERVHALSAFGIPIATSARGGTLVVEEARWQHIDPHKISDPKGYIDARFQFVVADVSFVRGSLLDDVPANQLSFRFTNQSVYGYWQPTFVIALYDGTTLVDVFPLAFSQLAAGEDQVVRIATLSRVDRVSEVRVLPLMNPFDDTIFLPPEP